MSSLTVASALRKLEAKACKSSPLRFEDLPDYYNDPLWMDIAEKYEWTLAEHCAMKNARCTESK
jgi:hypothetical protein